ncbi:hypothetical protein KFE25_013719 [Diacronema lutheri]|uniref:SSD domain-containing protein n=1 Tax=Diacronema lutheri TaxID=2081491 RepID=A0A8J6CF09_DIALT|nr:hypothetical protein KFE25_013719 [Diacronema lutheri]
MDLPYAKLASARRSPARAGFADAAVGAVPGGVKIVTHGIIERQLAELFRRVGLWVGRHPRRAIGASLLAAISCALLIPAFLTFEADPVALYIPQRSALAQQRRYIERTFGIWDEPGILVVKHKTPGTSIMQPDFLLAAMDLHERVQRVVAPAPGAGGGELAMADVCARRFVTLTGDYVCAVLSALEQWGYSKDKLASDTDIVGTLAKAHAHSEVDLGGMVVTPAGQMVKAEALQIKYFFNVSVAHYHDGGTLAWDRALRALLDDVNAHEPLLSVSYWSALFIEEEAQSFVAKDSYLMALSMVFIMFYVCIALGGVTYDIRTSRMLLGTTSAVCVSLAMAAGFGLGALCGYPFQPINPIIVFTLLGVSVDDMIIIVDAFERTRPADPVALRLSESMAVSGSTITVTSFTSAFVFFTAIWVDFPALTNFCVPAGFCVLSVYVLQLFFFAGCLVLDTLRQEAGRADVVPCFVPESDEAAACCAQYRPPPLAAGGKPTRAERPIQLWFRTRYPRLLLQPRTRVAVVVGFLAPVLLAARQIPDITVGLPLRQTLAESSPVLRYVDDLETYWRGAQTQEAWLVYMHTNVTDARALRAANRAMSALTDLDSVLRIHVNWLAGFRDWYECKGDREWPPTSSAPVGEFIHDEGVYTCVHDEAGATAHRARRGSDDGANARGSVGGLALGATGARRGAHAHAHGARARADAGGGGGGGASGASGAHAAPAARLGAGLERAEGAAAQLGRAGARRAHRRLSGAELRRRLALLDEAVADAPQAASALAHAEAAPAPRRALAAVGPPTADERQHAAAMARAQAVSAHEAAVKARVEAAQARAAIGASAAAARRAAHVQGAGAAVGSGGPSGAARARPAHGSAVPRSALPLAAPPALATAEEAPAAAADGAVSSGAPAPSPSTSPAPATTGGSRCAPMATRLARTPDEAREFLPAATETGHCSYERPAGAGATAPHEACSSKYFCNGLHGGCWQCRDPPSATSRCVGESARVPRAQAAAHFAADGTSEVSHCALVSADSGCAKRFQCLGAHGACFRCAEPGHAARLTHRAHSTVNADGGTSAWDPDVPCFDANAQFARLSGKYTCAEAASHCTQGETGWRIVRAYCPLSCGLCTPSANATSVAAGADVASGYEVAVGGRDYESDVLVGASSGEVAASRIVFSTSMPPTFVDVYGTYLKQRAALEKLAAAELSESGVALDAFVYHIQYEFAYADWVMPSFGAQNLAMAAAAVLVCVAAFLPVSIALLCTFAVVCIDVLLLGGMALLHTPLNTITLVSLLLAMALAIDYSCHIGHAYVIAPGTTRLEKTHHALEYMGFSVLNAGLSTLLGTLFLAASQSPVFRIFFVAVWSTILLGLIAGLAFVPVMLSYIGPLDDVPAPSRVGSRSDLRPLGASRTPSRSPFSAKAATRVSSRHELSFKPSFSGVEQLSPPHALAHGGAPCHALGAADIARTPGGGTGAPLPSVDRADPTHGTFGVAHPPVLSMSAGAEPSVGYPTSIARCEPLARTTVVDGAPGADGFRRPLPHAASAPRLHLPQ